MDDRPPTSSPGRWLLLPLVPVVALWDLGRALMRRWIAFGERQLTATLDPLFARLTRVLVRFTPRWGAAAERWAARFHRVVAALGRPVATLGRLLRAPAAWWTRGTAPIRRGWRAALGATRRLLRPVVVPFARAGRAVAGVARRGRAAVRAWRGRVGPAVRRWWPGR